MVRMTEKEIQAADYEYSQQYQLYNVISSVVEEYDGCKGGLRAPEVWRDVLELEHRLPTVPRPDRFVASERTRLYKEYRRFKYKGADGKLCWESEAERDRRDVERSVNCVLLAFGMRLASYPNGEKNPYEPIMSRIREMLMQSEDLELLSQLVNEYYNSEDQEEAIGNFVPEEDVLKPHIKPILNKELQKKRDYLKTIVVYYTSVLEYEELLKDNVDGKTFNNIWNDLLMNETILVELSKPNVNIRNTLNDDDLKKDEPNHIVLSNDYNLKLMMNLLGVIIEMGLLKTNISQTRKVFFNDNKDIYFSPNSYKKFGDSQSGFPTKEMYETVIKIINNHIKR